MLASSILAGGSLAGAGQAAADGGAGGDVAGGAGLVARLQPDLVHWGKVDIGGRPYEAGLFDLHTAQGADVYTYCIDLNHETRDGARYQETDWSATSLADKPEAAGKIGWILAHSYPARSVGEVARQAGIPDLDEDEAAAGTQAAIWHFSDGVDAVPQDSRAAELTRYLLGQAKVQQEPRPSLALSPQAVSGRSGELVGPVTVHTGAAKAQLSLDAAAARTGVLLVDRNGRKLPSRVADGTEAYFSVPAGTAPGDAGLTVTATTEVPVGRAFTDADYTASDHSQTMILAGSQPVQVSATATASWSDRHGPIPAITAKEHCSDGAVVVTAADNGDADFVFTLAGRTVTVKPGAAQSVPVKVAEDQSYAIEVTGPGGFRKVFRGVLDCKTSHSGGGASTGPVAATAAGGSTGGTPDGPTAPASRGSDLAETGASSATPLVAGLAAGLVAAGAGVVLALRRRGRSRRPS